MLQWTDFLMELGNLTQLSKQSLSLEQIGLELNLLSSTKEKSEEELMCTIFYAKISALVWHAINIY